MGPEKRTSQPLQRFNKDANGNAMVFVVLVMFTLVCFLVFTIHIGQRFTNKVEMQNAADAAVISGAVWKARGFNLVSLLNVSMSECLALIIMFKAFDSTLTLTKIAHRIQLIAWTACCNPLSNLCCIMAGVMKGYSIYGIPYVNYVNNVLKKTWKSPKILWNIMKYLKNVSEFVSAATATMAYHEASNIARLNGASMIGSTDIGGSSADLHAVLWPVQLKLPVKDDPKNFEEDLCNHTWHGGDGYKNYLCYDNALDISIAGIPIDKFLYDLWIPLSAIVPQPIFTYNAMKQYHYDELCSSSGSSVDPASYVPAEAITMQCDVCTQEEGTSRWSGVEIELNEYKCDDIHKKKDSPSTPVDPQILHNGKIPGVVIHEGQDPDSENTDPQYDLGSLPSCKTCSNLRKEEPEGDSADPPRFFAIIWTLEKCTYELDREDIGVQTQDHSGDKTPPLVLADSWKEDVKYTSLVFKRENRGDSSHLLGFDGKPIVSQKSNMSGEMITYGEDGNSELGQDHVNIPKRTWAVARAIVYVPDSGQEDLFNQNWHAKLAPVDVKGIKPKFLGLEIPLPEKLTNLLDDTAEEIWTH